MPLRLKLNKGASIPEVVQPLRGLATMTRGWLHPLRYTQVADSKHTVAHAWVSPCR